MRDINLMKENSWPTGVNVFTVWDFSQGHNWWSHDYNKGKPWVTLIQNCKLNLPTGEGIWITISHYFPWYALLKAFITRDSSVACLMLLYQHASFKLPFPSWWNIIALKGRSCRVQTHTICDTHSLTHSLIHSHILFAGNVIASYRIVTHLEH